MNLGWLLFRLGVCWGGAGQKPLRKVKWGLIHSWMITPCPNLLVPVARGFSSGLPSTHRWKTPLHVCTLASLLSSLLAGEQAMKEQQYEVAEAKYAEAVEVWPHHHRLT